MSSLSTKEAIAKFNKLSNDMNVKLIKRKRIFINNGRNLRKKPTDLSIKNKQIAFCSNLPFGLLLSPSRILFLLMHRQTNTSF